MSWPDQDDASAVELDEMLVLYAKVNQVSEDRNK